MSQKSSSTPPREMTSQWESFPWFQQTHKRLLARILHGLEAVEAARLWETPDDELRKVMLIGGRPGDWSNSVMTLSHNVHNRLIAGSTTHSHAMLYWHVCANTGR